MWHPGEADRWWVALCVPAKDVLPGDILTMWHAGKNQDPTAPRIWPVGRVGRDRATGEIVIDGFDHSRHADRFTFQAIDEPYLARPQQHLAYFGRDELVEIIRPHPASVDSDAVAAVSIRETKWPSGT